MKIEIKKDNISNYDLSANIHITKVRTTQENYWKFMVAKIGFRCD